VIQDTPVSALRTLPAAGHGLGQTRQGSSQHRRLEGRGNGKLSKMWQMVSVGSPRSRPNRIALLDCWYS